MLNIKHLENLDNCSNSEVVEVTGEICIQPITIKVQQYLNFYGHTIVQGLYKMDLVNDFHLTLYERYRKAIKLEETKTNT